MKENIRWAVLVGVIMATVYSAWVTGLYLVGGSQVFTAHNTSLLMVVLTYFCVGVLGGLVVGVALPIAKHPLGAIVVGVMVGLIFFFCIEVVTAGPISHWTASNTKAVLVLGLLWGGPAGLITWRTWRK